MPSERSSAVLQLLAVLALDALHHLALGGLEVVADGGLMLAG